jgi:hypothetical protein
MNLSAQTHERPRTSRCSQFQKERGREGGGGGGGGGSERGGGGGVGGRGGQRDCQKERQRKRERRESHRRRHFPEKALNRNGSKKTPTGRKKGPFIRQALNQNS